MELKTQNELEEFYRQNIGKYIIINDRSQKDNVLECAVKFISLEDFRKMETHVQLLDEFSFYIKKKKEIDMNYDDAYNFQEESEKKLKEMSAQERNKYSETLYLDANRKLTNYLSSLITFINDYIGNSIIKKEFGKDSPEFQYFKDKTAYWYDHCFPYKFFYHLRNYAIHYKFPLQSIYYNTDLNEDKKEPFSLSVKLVFNKHKLLQNKTFKKKLAYELASYNDEFLLLPLLEQIIFIHREILKVLLEIIGNKYILSAQFILDQISERNDSGIFSFGKIVENNENIGIETKIIQVEIAKEILKLHSLSS